jgi:hypothetical protein
MDKPKLAPDAERMCGYCRKVYGPDDAPTGSTIVSQDGMRAHFCTVNCLKKWAANLCGERTPWDVLPQRLP